MSTSQNLFNLIAECQAMTRAELVHFTGWTGAVVDAHLRRMLAVDAIRRQNIGGRSHYVVS